MGVHNPTSKLMVCLVASSLLFLVLARGAAGQQPSAPATECSTAEPVRAPATVDPSARATLVSPDSADVTFDFERSRVPDVLGVRLRVTSDSSPLPPVGTELLVTRARFRRGSASFPPTGVTTRAVVATDQSVDLTVCLDPRGVDPGRYVGAVNLDDPRLVNMSVPTIVNLQYERWFLLGGAAGAITLVIGPFIVWANGRRAQGKTPWGPGSRASYVDFLASNVVTLCFAIVAAGTAFYVGYWQNKSWGGDAWQAITLVGAMVSAFIATLTTSSTLPEAP